MYINFLYLVFSSTFIQFLNVLGPIDFNILTRTVRTFLLFFSLVINSSSWYLVSASFRVLIQWPEDDLYLRSKQVAG